MRRTGHWCPRLGADPDLLRRRDRAPVTEQPDLHDWQPLVDDLRAAPGAGAGHGRRASRSSASGAWASCPSGSGSTSSSTPARSWSWASWPTRWTRRCRPSGATSPPTAWWPGSAPSTAAGSPSAPTTSRCWPARWAPSARPKTARIRELALRQRIPIVWLLDSAGARIQSSSRVDVRRRRRAVPRAGDDERRRPAGGGHARPLRRRHRLHPGAGRLRPDGEGHVVDGPRRPPPRAGGHRRGRHRGGDGRLRGPHQGLGRRRPGGGVRRGVPRRRAPLPVVLPVAQPGGAARSRATSDPVDRRVEELYKHRADRAPRGPTT